MISISHFNDPEVNISLKWLRNSCYTSGVDEDIHFKYEGKGVSHISSWIPCQLHFNSMHFNILYTALNSPSLIFALSKSETDSPSSEFAHPSIFLHNPLHINSILAQFWIRPQARQLKGRKQKRGEWKWALYIETLSPFCNWPRYLPLLT